MVSHLKCRLLLFARSNYKLHNDLLCIYQWRHFLAIDQFLFDSSNIAYKVAYDFPALLNLLKFVVVVAIHLFLEKKEAFLIHSCDL